LILSTQNLIFLRASQSALNRNADKTAQKIKADLIERAKMKKNYAKVLKAEGMESERLQDRSGSGKSRSLAEGEGEDGTAGKADIKQGRDERKPRGTLDRKGKGRSYESNEPPVLTAQRKRALSPSDIGPPMALTELKALKEKAYAKPTRPAETGRVAQGGMVRGAKGQPNMGARMGVLLERIKAGRK
jgi:hypothetical protein